MDGSGVRGSGTGLSYPHPVPPPLGEGDTNVARHVVLERETLGFAVSETSKFCSERDLEGT